MIAIIPARGGSKGLPKKNILSFAGKPLIAHTILAAKESSCIDDVIVSTDNDEIRDISLEYGARVPFVRPQQFSTDTASAIDVYLHAVDYLEKEANEMILKFMVLLPTTPLRTSVDIDYVYQRYTQEKPDTVISIREPDTPPSWYMRLDDASRITVCNFGGNNEMKNRQLNDRYGVVSGAVYILDYELLRSKRTYYSTNTLGVFLPNTHSVDIDNIDDFLYAEYLYGKRELL